MISPFNTCQTMPWSSHHSLIVRYPTQVTHVDVSLWPYVWAMKHWSGWLRYWLVSAIRETCVLSTWLLTVAMFASSRYVQNKKQPKGWLIANGCLSWYKPPLKPFGSLAFFSIISLIDSFWAVKQALMISCHRKWLKAALESILGYFRWHFIEELKSQLNLRLAVFLVWNFWFAMDPCCTTIEPIGEKHLTGTTFRVPVTLAPEVTDFLPTPASKALRH